MCLFSISVDAFQRGSQACWFPRRGSRAFSIRFCQHFFTCLCFKWFHFSYFVDCYVPTPIVFSLTWWGEGVNPSGHSLWWQTHNVCWAWPTVDSSSRWGVWLGQLNHRGPKVSSGRTETYRTERKSVAWSRYCYVNVMIILLVLLIAQKMSNFSEYFF